MKNKKKLKILICIFTFILICIFIFVFLLIPNAFLSGENNNYNSFDKNLKNKIYIDELTVIETLNGKKGKFIFSNKSELIEVQKNLSYQTIPFENHSVGGRYIPINYEFKFSNGDKLTNGGDLYFANEKVYMRVYFHAEGNPYVFIRLDDKLDALTKVELIKAFP